MEKNDYKINNNCSIFKIDLSGCRPNLNIREPKYIHSLTGNVGTFVEKRNGYHGEIMIIKLENGREYFAPTNEFVKVNLQ